MRKVIIVTLCSLTQGNSESYEGYRTYKQMHLWYNSEAEDAQHLLHTKPPSKDSSTVKGELATIQNKITDWKNSFRKCMYSLYTALLMQYQTHRAENVLSSHTGRTLNYLKHTSVQP